MDYDLTKDDYIIYGEGKGGGGHQPTEADDTISVSQTAKVLLVLGEGEIQSIDEVYLNQTPITNFPGASYQFRNGTSNQSTIPGFGEIESSVLSSPVTLPKATPYVRSFPYEVSAVRVTIGLQSLRRSLDNGDIVGYQVDFDIHTKGTPAGIYDYLKTSTKKEKASAPFTWDVRVNRPSNAVPGQQWTLKVTRITADDATIKTNSVSSINAITELQFPSPALTYPNTALLALTLGNAEQFGGRLPEVTIKLKGEKVFLPTNYNAGTRTYTGNWNGSFKTVKEYTNNPFWILLHVLTQRLNLSVSEIDLGAFYSGAQYADQSVSNGEGGFEPRYTINNAFVERENPHKFFTYILSLCNANFTSNEFGQVSLLIDKAGQTVSRIVNNTNVIDGHFEYSSNDIESRFNQANVTYNEPTLLGDTQTVTFQDDALITRYGLQPTDIVLAGCYSEAQAIRKARWVVWTNSYDTEFITFKKMFEGALYQVGDLVDILDSRNSGFNVAGVIKSVSFASNVQTFVLDREVTLGSGLQTITFINSNGDEVSMPLAQNNGTFSTVTSNQSSITNIIAQSAFMITSPTVKPITARVIKIVKDSSFYTITCVKHNENKYAYIDGAITKVPRPSNFVNINNFSITAPHTVAVTEVFASNAVVKSKSLHITWQWTKGTQTFQPLYRVMWRRDNQSYRVINNLTTPNYDITDAAPGQYEIYVFAINPISNIASTGAQYAYAYRVSAAGSTLDPVTTVRIQGTAGLTFQQKDVNLEILHNTANDNKTDKLKDYVVEVWTADGITKKATYIVRHDANHNGLFTFTYDQNTDVFGTPQRTFQIKVYCRDLIGDLSAAKAVTVTNPVPGVVSFSVLSGVDVSYIDIDRPAVTDLAGFIVYRSTTSGFTPGVGNQVYQGVGDSITLTGTGGTTYYYKVAAYDSFGTTGLSVSGEIANTPLSGDAIQWRITSGLIFHQNSPAVNQISWTAGTIVKSLAGVPTTYSIAAGSATWTTGTLYIYFSGSGTALSSTTTLATAVVSNGWLIGSYSGGVNWKGGTGEAFTDGSTILAGTVGANQLITGSAVITGSAQIADAIITNTKIANAAIDNAKIANVIQSNNFNAATSTGWKIDKAGNLTSYGTINLYDGTGAPILTTGDTAGVYWDQVINKTGFASINQITSSNVTTYIANGAILNAQIGNAQINNAKIAALAVQSANIADLNVTTLKIAGNAVTLPQSIVTVERVFVPGSGTTYVQVQALTVPAAPVPQNVNIQWGAAYESVRATVKTSSISLLLTYQLTGGTVVNLDSAGDRDTALNGGSTQARGRILTNINLTVPANKACTFRLMALFNNSGNGGEVYGRQITTMSIKR